MAKKFFPQFVKWLIIPTVMGAVGFFALGPKIGDTGIVSTVEPVKDLIEDNTSGGTRDPINVPEDKGKFGNVKLDVNLTKDDKSKPDSATKKPEKTEYFSPDAGTQHEELSDLPNTPTTSGNEEPIPKSNSDDSGW
ncbi:MAG: hypothetical protein ACKVQS_01775 [Fimbriimonadaceae bacterium]